jgi:hypothetical protein
MSGRPRWMQRTAATTQPRLMTAIQHSLAIAAGSHARRWPPLSPSSPARGHEPDALLHRFVHARHGLPRPELWRCTKRGAGDKAWVASAIESEGATPPRAQRCRSLSSRLLTLEDVREVYPVVHPQHVVNADVRGGHARQPARLLQRRAVQAPFPRSVRAVDGRNRVQPRLPLVVQHLRGGVGASRARRATEERAAIRSFAAERRRAPPTHAPPPGSPARGAARAPSA